VRHFNRFCVQERNDTPTIKPPITKRSTARELSAVAVTVSIHLRNRKKGNTMCLNNIIATSAKWLDECCSHIDGAELDDCTRNRVSASLLDLALEHHGAIQILVSNKTHPHYGSALALLRPQFESYVRGVWFHRCASEQDIDKFIKGAEPPKVDELILAIETLPGHEEGLLNATKQNVWKTMCGLTHGGTTQVASRNSATDITADYTDEQVRWLLSWACSLTLLVSIAFANLLSNNVMANELLSTYRKLFPQRP
jgi:hypothetical protein